MQKGLGRFGYVKDFEMGKLSWFVQMDPAVIGGGQSELVVEDRQWNHRSDIL